VSDKRKLLITLMSLTLVLIGCQGLAQNSQPPTPTAISLPPQPGPTHSPQAEPSPTPVPTTSTPTAAAAIPATATPMSKPPESASISPTATQPAPPPVRIMALGAQLSLTLRSLPDKHAPVVTVVPGSDVLWAEARSPDGQWLRVTFGEERTEAWAASEDLTLLGSADSLPLFAPEPIAGSTEPTEASAGALTGQILANSLNVRSGPGLDESLLGQLTAGDRVTVIGRSEQGNWLAIAWAGDTAWVAAQFVEVVGEVSELPALAADITGASPPAPALPGKVVFQTRIGGDIYLINSDGSGLRWLAEGLDPALSPDGTQVAYARWGSPHAVFVLNLRSGQEQRLAAANRPRSPTWSPGGTRLAFSHYTGSFTCIDTPLGCFDEDTVRQWLGGEECIDTPQGRFCISDFPVRQVEEFGLAQVTLADGAWLDLASESTAQSPQWHPHWDEILYRGRGGLQITTPDGETRALVARSDVGSPAWSPSGQQIAVQIHLHDHTDIFLLDAAGNIQRRLTESTSSGRAPNNVAPTWSPDGRFILFLSDRDGSWRLYQMNADGSDQAPFLPNTLDDFALKYDFAAERVASWGP